MRVLFTTSELPTHYFPMVPLGWALQAAGHEVRFACTPAAAEPISRAGLTPLPVLDGPDQLFKVRLAYYWAALAAGGEPEPGTVLHPVTGEGLRILADFDLAGYARGHRESNLAMMRESCDRVVDFARAWRPDLVVFEPQTVEGVLAGKLLDVPVVCHLFGPVGTHETGPGLNIVLEDHSESFARHGLPEMSADLIDHAIDPCPPGIAGMTSAPRLPLRCVPYNGPGTAPAWTTERPESGRRRVLVAWGTILRKMFGPQAFRLPDIVAALGGLDVEVVLAAVAADRAELGALPDNVRVLDRWAPLNQILPSCDAVVHHGGGGTMLTAMMAGVPQLCTGFMAEQVANGRRLASVGAGLHEDGFTVSASTVREGVVALLDEPDYRAGARELRVQALRQPSPAAVVRTLERIA